MTISREQHAQRNAIRGGIIAAMRDNLDDEFTAAEICDAMTAPIDRDSRIVGANLKIMASEGLVESSPRQNIHVYRLLPAALDWRPPAFHRPPRVNPGYQRPASTLQASQPPASPLPVESREDEAPAPPISQPTAEDSSEVHPPYLVRAELDQVWPTDRFSETRQTSRTAAAIDDYSAIQPPFAWLLAEPDQPLESPPPSQETATDIHLNSLPDRWLPELRLRLLGDSEGMPEIILHVHTEGGGAFWTMRTRGPVTFDPGEAAFLPTLGDALCQFINHISPPTPVASPYGAHKDQP
jgi:hypothetical protein